MFANACDHLRIKGMGPGYVVLLREVGVDTVRELRYRKPENLVSAMAEANRKKKLVRLLPSRKAGRALDRPRQEAPAQDHLQEIGRWHL